MLVFNGHVWDITGICQYCGMNKEQIFKSPGVECVRALMKDISDLVRS